ncbi:hypothetical protein DRE_03263 [Drechslerella stenobrocha 248]|uniref:Uncharacterized protein n=1 Tax=Drechslerella stenobrocha 248 TaxID=1043628 RepID=W7I662_9PEZI|nr:hypothetical protein DRE_03263 [Drechslerella stenobrocha 248]
MSSDISTAKLRDTLSRAPRNSAYARHIEKCLQYVDFYGGAVPAAAKGKTERDLLEEEFQFLRDDENTGGQGDAAKEIAKKYYDSLFREFALIDLSRWREGQVALRWRTKKEVLQGLGQFTCASLTCPRHAAPSDEITGFRPDAEDGNDGEEDAGLEPFEMNFGYMEKGIKKNALVKVCVCRKCAGKLRKIRGAKVDSRHREEHRDRERGRRHKEQGGSHDRDRRDKDRRGHHHRDRRDRGADKETAPRSTDTQHCVFSSTTTTKYHDDAHKPLDTTTQRPDDRQMTDWKALGYVPDSEGEDDDDILLSPPQTSVHPTTTAPDDGERPQDDTQSRLAIYDLPSSSAEVDAPVSLARGRGRGRPPKRGRGAKRLSVGGDTRLSKHARVEEPNDLETGLLNEPAIPSRSQEAKVAELTSLLPSSSQDKLASDSHPRAEENHTVRPGSAQTRSLDFTVEVIGLQPADVSLLAGPDAVTPPPQLSSEPGIQNVDLVDQHGPNSEPEENGAPELMPPSSPPIISQISLLSTNPNSPAPSTPVSTILATGRESPSHQTGLSDPATRLNIQSSSDGLNVTVDDFTIGVARNLRQRKLIQLKPYQVEMQRYTSAFRSRGLRPVKYVYNEDLAQPNNQDPQGGSQEQDWVAPEVEEEDETQTAGGQAESFQSVDTEPMATENLQNDTLPALDELYLLSRSERPANPGTRNTPHGNKRQKTQHAFQPSLRTRKIMAAAKASIARGQAPAGVSIGLPQAHVTPNTEVPGVPSIFQLESSDTEPMPDTPPTSVSRRRVVLDSDESESEENTAPKPNGFLQESQLSDGSESSGSLESDHGVQEREISRFQRKARGVLPASYLRLNQPATPSITQKRTLHNQKSPGKLPMVRGIAQMRIRSRASPPPGSMVAPLTISSGESSDESTPPAVRVPGTPSVASSPKLQQAVPSRKVYSSRSDAFEDNAIDRMLSRPSGPRSGAAKKTVHTKKRLTQSKLKNGSVRQSQPGATRPASVHQRPRVKPAALSVVDACKRYRDTKCANPPQFMRIAERRAKKRKDGGRQLPDRKVIKIDQILDDETDGEDTLTKWKRAKLARSSSISSLRGSLPSPQINTPLGSSSNQPIDRPAGNSKYLQTKILHHHQTSSAQGKLKLGVRAGATHRPIAMLPRQGQLRIDQISNKLQQRIANNRIGDTAPDFQIGQTGLPPKTAAPLFINQPRGRLFVNDHREVFDIDGKLPPSPVRRRKKPLQPRHMEKDRQPAAFRPPERTIQVPDVMEIDSADDEGLLSFENMPPTGTRFSSDFDIRLPTPKMLFGETTFLRDGHLSRALKTPAGRTSSLSRGNPGLQNFWGQDVEWDVYNESVGSQFEGCTSNMLQRAERIINEPSAQSDWSEFILDLRVFFGYVVQYLYGSLYFSDLIDIASFVGRFSDIISDTVSKTTSLSLLDDSASQKLFFNIFRLEVYSYTSIIFHQIFNIMGNDGNTLDTNNIAQLQKETLHRLISILMNTGMPRLQDSLSKTSQIIIMQGQLNEAAIYLECWVIAYHLSQTSNTKMRATSFWEAVNDAVGLIALGHSRDIETLESAWMTLFRLLPLGTINSWGKILPISDDGFLPGNWRFVREIVGKSLQIHNSLRPKAQSSAAEYIKALFARCLILLRDWRWPDSELIITKLYDFFAKRGLNNMQGEADHGSPAFLQHLDTPIFDSDSLETCFSTFLKITALGLQRMRRASNHKAINGLVIRLMPNHGRMFLKEESLALTDLNTLRNHHDLLTAVYSGVGLTHKKRVIGIFRQLVDPEKSHSNICSLSLRTWSNVLTFELADEKTPEILQELMQWHSHIIQATIQVLRELKIQADQARRATVDQTLIDDINRNAQANKRSLESILSSGLNLLDWALRNPNCDFYSAQLLLVADSMKQIFGMSHSLPQGLVAKAVNIVSAHVRVCKNFGFSLAQDESQTWAGFDNAESDEIRREAGKKLLDEIYDPLFDLINSYFAGEEIHLDQALVPCIEVWIELGSLLVQCGLKNWGDYFNAYRKNWFSMIDTDNKKTYSVSYVTNIMKADSSVYNSYKPQILQVWISSLVERESLLKFQHDLTSTIFNYDMSNTLFANMPFEVDPELERYEISLRVFKERRLSLVSTLLENMQKEMFRVQASTVDYRQQSGLKMEYAKILQDLMNTMKRNYTEIHSHSKTTTTGVVASSYVNFCQQIVEQLQQYTTDICPIDKFFVDSVTFPLPANDPIYVTSKLKGYALKLGKSGGFTSFIQFFQNTCGRVAAEGQQGYFIKQIINAFEEQGERESVLAGRSTLREVCMLAVFGTYIKRSMEGLANLIIAVPIVLVAEKTVKKLACEFDGLEEDRRIDRHISGFLVTLLDAIVVAVDKAIEHRDLVLNEPLAVYVLGLLAQVVYECDLMVNLLHPRVVRVSDELSLDLLKAAVRGLSRLKAYLQGRQLVPDKLDTVMSQIDLPLKLERRKFEEEFQKELRNWRVGEGGKEVVIHRLGGKKAVRWEHLLPSGDVEAERRGLVKRLERVIGETSRGVCEGIVREADQDIWDRIRRPMVGMADVLFGVQRVEITALDEPDSDADGIFDMED